MMIVRFRNQEDHGDLLKKVKKMKKFTEELEECLEDVLEEDYDFRKREWEEEPQYRGGRYGYRSGGRR